MLRARLFLPFILAVCISKCCTEEFNEGKKWVVLAAGSNTYVNYRHQSDVYHAYQVVRERGIPSENIIVLHYDDIAYNKKNPKKGKIFNKPNGPNVYVNIPKDYVGEQVTPQNFLNVLSGNADKMKNIGSGRVVNSTEKDTIFIYYSDHGGKGIIAMGRDKLLFASDFLETLEIMCADKKYKKMAIVVEACYSGSIFEHTLSEDLGTYAMTAANSDESSFSRYWDQSVQAFLGDEFSTKFLEILDTDANPGIDELYAKLKTSVTGSHVQQFGDMSVIRKPISTFIGSKSLKSRLPHRRLVHRANYTEPDLIPTISVPLVMLQKEIDSATNFEEKEILVRRKERLLKNRAVADKILDNILMDACENDDEKYATIKKMNSSITRDNMRCAKSATEAFDTNCFRVTRNPYTVVLIEDLVKLCDVDWLNEEQIVEVIQHVCEEYEDKPTNVL